MFKQERLEEQRRQAARLQKASRPGASGAFAGIDAERLKRAAEWRPWLPCDVPNMGFQSCLATYWADGRMTMRLALVGNRQGIEAFMPQWTRFRVKFMDVNGATLSQWNIDPAQYRWANPSINNGVPTMEFETSVDYPLELYETGRNWNFFWER